jgi:hypothetical protein
MRVEAEVRVGVGVGVGVRYLGLRDIAIGESSVCNSDIAGNTWGRLHLTASKRL